MFSTTLDALTSEFPEELEAITRLRAMVSTPPKAPLPAQRLFDLLQPSNFRVLALIMSRAAQEGLVEKIFRVESRKLGGIGDFPALEEIPAVLFDMRIGEEVEVQPDQISLLYKFLGESEG